MNALEALYLHVLCLPRHFYLNSIVPLLYITVAFFISFRDNKRDSFQTVNLYVGGPLVEQEVKQIVEISLERPTIS